MPHEALRQRAATLSLAVCLSRSSLVRYAPRPGEKRISVRLPSRRNAPRDALDTYALRSIVSDENSISAEQTRITRRLD